MLVEIAPLPTVTASLQVQRIHSLPVLVLNLHSRCNCRCVMCDIWKLNAHLELPLAILEKQIESVRDLRVRWVVLSGGEPLMHTKFVEICRMLRALDVRITVLTAGLTLHKRAKDVAHNVDDVIVSLDGPHDVHDRIRGIRGAYDLLSSGVIQLLAYRPELRISARTTVQKLNHACLLETVAAAQELDLSGISFLPVDQTSGAFNRETPWESAKHREIGLTAVEVERLEIEVRGLVERYAKEIETGYIAEDEAKLARLTRYFRANLEQMQHQAPRCNAPWVSAVVEHDGSIRPCFFHSAVGNLHQQSLAESVNGHSALAFRGSLDVAGNPICQRCVCSLYRPQHASVASLQTSDKSDIGV